MNCTNGAIRLSGGRDQNEGRVEVCSNRVWGTISRSGWDSNDAMVACKQLGLFQPDMLTSKCGYLHDSNHDIKRTKRTKETHKHVAS